MKKYALGEFEEIVMLTVAILYENAYGITIKKDIETRLKRSVSVGAMRTALNRLDAKYHAIAKAPAAFAHQSVANGPPDRTRGISTSFGSTR